MTNTPKYTAPLTHHFHTTHLLTLTLLIVSLCATGCSSHCNRSDRISRIADQQLVVIESLRGERKSPEVISRVQKDTALGRAEGHLTQALDALERSVQAIKQEENK